MVFFHKKYEVKLTSTRIVLGMGDLIGGDHGRNDIQQNRRASGCSMVFSQNEPCISCSVKFSQNELQKINLKLVTVNT
jgi:hypothetical protein